MQNTIIQLYSHICNVRNWGHSIHSKLWIYFPFLSNWWWPVEPKHVFELILNKWVVVFAWIYCSFFLASLLFLTAETRDVSYNEPLGVCGGESGNWPDISLDTFDPVVQPFTTPLVPARINTFDATVRRDSDSPLKSPPPPSNLYVLQYYIFFFVTYYLPSRLREPPIFFTPYQSCICTISPECFLRY
jgi:hypothetical protein